MNIHTQGRTTPAKRPRKPKGGVSASPAMTEPGALKALRRLRREAQAEVDRLIALIDRIDGDPDLEMTGDDEPSLGWCGTACGVALGLVDERSIEDSHDDRELDDCDDEDTHDREEECEDEGAQCDDEGDQEHDGGDLGFPDWMPSVDKGPPAGAPPPAIVRHLEEERGESDMIPMIDGTWLVMHRGQQHTVTVLPPLVRP